MPITRFGSIRRGPWCGCMHDGIECYYGIRYARLARQEQPLGCIAPSAIEQLDVADLTDVPVFPQLPSRLESVTGSGGRINPQADDAFFLNVWTPQAATRLPVLVFIHGGAWASGGGAMRWYRGQGLAAEGVVVVTLNYRLGPAGHMGSGDTESEAGIHQPFGDLLVALRWVRVHIGEFGGDPDRVTLAGQSAGAWYAWALACLPQAAGLLHQAALLSIPHITPWTAAYRTDFTRHVQALNHPIGSETPRQALLRAGSQVLAATPHTPGAMPPMYLPTLTEEQAQRLANADSAAQHFHARALYVRVTRHEMSAFLPPIAWAEANTAGLLHTLRQRSDTVVLPQYAPPAHWSRDYAEAVALSSWQEFGHFSSEIATAIAQCGHPVVQRDFAALASPAHLGSVHCMDLPFQFGNFADWADAPILAQWTAEAFEPLSQSVRADLASFIYERHDPKPQTLGDPAIRS